MQLPASLLVLDSKAMQHLGCRGIAGFTLTALIFLCGLRAAPAAVPGDEHWDSQFGPVGTSDQLWSIAVVGGTTYVGGLLTAAGNTKANFVAGYDGTNWFR